MNNHSAVTSAGSRSLLTTGSFVRVVRLEDEWYEDLEEPDLLLQELRSRHFPADVFTFWQRLPDTAAKYPYYREYDDLAVLDIATFDHWWNHQLDKKARNLVRKAEKKGVQVRETTFDDAFVRGMTEIFNEVPFRQGRRFAHYGKDFDTVKAQFSRYLFREEVIGAYYGDELIGFVFLAYAGRYAITGQIISKIAHRDKSPNNALIAKAVEVCSRKGIPSLVYAFWGNSSLTEFKRQNGFQQKSVPRYYVPLTLRGRIYLRLRLHKGLPGLLPERLSVLLKALRARWYTNPA